MSKELKAIEILTYLSSWCSADFANCCREAIKELEEYEQNFKQKEFEYRTNCQNLVSAGRVEADNMPDRLAELEKVILDYYLAKGYQVGVGGWGFTVSIENIYKFKNLKVLFYDKKENISSTDYDWTSPSTKHMFKTAIKYFSTRQNEVITITGEKNEKDKI